MALGTKVVDLEWLLRLREERKGGGLRGYRR